MWADRSLFYLAKMFIGQINPGDSYHVFKKCVSSGIELWAKFINAESREEFDMLAQKDPYIDSAYQKLQVISQDKEKRLEYEAREKAIRDYNTGILEAEQRGEERGEKRGEKRGEERINQLNLLLIQNERFDNLKHATCDKNFQQQLMAEYGILPRQ